MPEGAFNKTRVRSACEKKLDIQFGSNKDPKGWFKLDGKKMRMISIPKGRDKIPCGTYKNMANGLGLTVYEFDEMVGCKTGLKEFIAINKSRNWDEFKG